MRDFYDSRGRLVERDWDEGDEESAALLRRLMDRENELAASAARDLAAWQATQQGRDQVRQQEMDERVAAGLPPFP